MVNKGQFKKGYTPWNKGLKFGKIIYLNNHIDSKELFKKLYKIFWVKFIIELLLWQSYLYYLPKNPVNVFNVIFTGVYIFVIMIMVIILDSYRGRIR